MKHELTHHNCLCLLQNLAFDLARGRMRNEDVQSRWLKNLGDALRDAGLSEDMIGNTLNATDFHMPVRIDE